MPKSVDLLWFLRVPGPDDDNDSKLCTSVGRQLMMTCQKKKCVFCHCCYSALKKCLLSKIRMRILLLCYFRFEVLPKNDAAKLISTSLLWNMYANCNTNFNYFIIAICKRNRWWWKSVCLSSRWPEAFQTIMNSIIGFASTIFFFFLSRPLL